MGSFIERAENNLAGLFIVLIVLLIGCSGEYAAVDTEKNKARLGADDEFVDDGDEGSDESDVYQCNDRWRDPILDCTAFQSCFDELWNCNETCTPEAVTNLQTIEFCQTYCKCRLCGDDAACHESCFDICLCDVWCQENYEECGAIAREESCQKETCDDKICAEQAENCIEESTSFEEEDVCLQIYVECKKAAGCDAEHVEKFIAFDNCEADGSECLNGCAELIEYEGVDPGECEQSCEARSDICIDPFHLGYRCDCLTECSFLSGQVRQACEAICHTEYDLLENGNISEEIRPVPGMSCQSS